MKNATVIHEGECKSNVLQLPFTASPHLLFPELRMNVEKYHTVHFSGTF